MAILLVVKFPDKILSAKTAPVLQVTDVERKLARDMVDTMHAEHGVGLAANQVGVSKQIFVASADQVRGKELVFMNPKIIKKEGTLKEFEGCLSIPEFSETVRRFKRVWLRAQTLDGKTVVVEAQDLLARIFQHETDHLNGFLFIDRLGFLKSRRARKKLLKKIK